MAKSKKWETYEEVANYLLNQMASEFGLDKVESKQKILGLKSELEWEIDGKGCVHKGETFIIIECKRYTTSKVSKGKMAELAFKIRVTGASGGIIVTPIGFQKGAKIIAKSENIIPVTLSENSSSTDYVMIFLGKIKVGLSGVMKSSGKVFSKHKRKNGTTEDLGELVE